jgi:hypothetical protein
MIKEKRMVSCGVRDKIKEEHLSLSSMDVVKGDLRFNTTEIDCGQTAMGLPPVTSAVLLIAK